MKFADAEPMYPFNSWPTQAEYRALQSAYRRALGQEFQPKSDWGIGGTGVHRFRQGCGIGVTKLDDGSGLYAQVHSHEPVISYIRRPSGDRYDIHGIDVKAWRGVPRLIEEAPHPVDARQHVPVLHGTVYDHHHLPPQHIHHRAPARRGFWRW